MVFPLWISMMFSFFRGYQDLADRMRAVAASKHMNLSDVTISKTLIQTENERAVKTSLYRLNYPVVLIINLVVLFLVNKGKHGLSAPIC